MSYTPRSFARQRKTLDDVRVENTPSEKRNEVRKFYCKETEQAMDMLNMAKKTVSHSHQVVSENQEEEANQFS